jgi:hypothetical protein
VLSFIVVLSSYSQGNNNTIALKIILNSIAEKHQVTFNYLEDEITIFKIIPPNPDIPLIEKLNYISSKTTLEFKTIGKNYISIFNNKKLDKPFCGYILEDITNKPIEKVSIHYTNSATTVFSDENGYFVMPYKSAENIEISHVNYNKVIIQAIDLNKIDCPKILLKQFIKNLEDVIVPLVLTKGISKKNDGTYVINPKNFGILPGLTEPDVFQTMQQLPGVISVDQSTSNINVRGGTNDQNLYLWNGIRLFQTGHFFGLISVLNPNLPNKISISKNGTSAFYGESVSSTVDIATTTSNNENSNSIGINMLNVDFNSEFNISKKSKLAISGRRSYSDFFKTPTYTNFYNNSFQNTEVTSLNNSTANYKTSDLFNFYDFTIQLQQKIGKKNLLYIDGISIINHLELSQSKTDNNIEISRNSNINQITYGGNILLTTNWNKKNYSKINFYASTYALISDKQSIENDQILNQENKVLDIGFNLEFNHIINNFYLLKSGYQLNEIGIRNFDKINTPAFTRNINSVLLKQAAILELQYNSKNKKINSTIGLRGNYFEQFSKFLIEPRIQFNYAITNAFKVEILAEQKSQTSSQIIDLQNDFLGIEKRRWILSNNKDIPIIKNKQASIGFSFSKNKWLFTLDNFYKKVTGITSSSQAFQNQFEFTKSSGDYTVYGIEMLLQKQFFNLTNWITYTYNDNQYKFENFNPMSFYNNYDIKHNISFGTIYDFKKFKIALGAKWFTGRPVTLPKSYTPIVNTAQEQIIDYNSPNSSRLNDYFQLNASVGYTIDFNKKSNLQMGFSIQNILNRKNILNQFYRINTSNNTVEKVNTYSLALTPNAYLRYNF